MAGSPQRESPSAIPGRGARGHNLSIIEHDLDLIANADHIIDRGPGGGAAGGRVVATGTPRQLARDPGSITGRFVGEHLNHGQI